MYNCIVDILHYSHSIWFVLVPNVSIFMQYIVEQFYFLARYCKIEWVPEDLGKLKLYFLRRYDVEANVNRCV